MLPAKAFLAEVYATGKANLSEFAHFRGNIASGWSGRGGQCTNAYFPHADPVRIAAVSSPSSLNQCRRRTVRLVLGLSSRRLDRVGRGHARDGDGREHHLPRQPEQPCRYQTERRAHLTRRRSVPLSSPSPPPLLINPTVIPISEHQDTVGPITRSVADAAIVLSAIAGPDTNDNFTLAQPTPLPDYVRALDRGALAGRRIGVPRAVFLNDSVTGNDPYVNEVFEGALDVLRALGATVVDPADLPSAEAIAMSGNETIVLNTDFKVRASSKQLEGDRGAERVADSAECVV